jgi:hypothetical protein
MEDRRMANERGIRIYFNDGSSLSLAFPKQTDNPYARAVATEELMKRRILTVEADGSLLVIPFENIKYVAVYPASQPLPKHSIEGATVHGEWVGP